MKIAIDLTSLADNFSGIERVALNTALELLKYDEKNQYQLIFKREVHPAFADCLEKMQVECIVLPYKNKLWFYQVTLLIFLKKSDADLFFFPAFPSPYFFRKRKIINVIHDVGCWDCPETMTKKMVAYFRIMYCNAVVQSRKLVTVSEFSRQRICHVFKIRKDHVEVVYNGVTSNMYFAGEKEWKDIQKKYNLPQKYIMCLSTLEPRKNMKLLVQAFGELIQEGNCDCALVLAGRKGWKIEEFLQVIPDFCRDRIHITGYIDDKDLPYLYHYAQVFVFPSVYEGFGIPPLEAMAAGCPVICSDIEVLKEILGDYAVYFRNNDKMSLKNVLSAYMCGRLSFRYEDELMKYSRKYTYRSSADKLLRIFESIQ